jgi:cytochrome c-type biogenesis protein
MDTGLLVLAFVVGSVAVFNPCGFVLLPAYLSLIATKQFSDEEQLKQKNLKNALYPIFNIFRFSLGMTIGFVSVFTFFGALLIVGANMFSEVAAWMLPLLSFSIGVALVFIGISALIFGKMFGLKNLLLKGVAPTKGFLTEIGYGATFALASLSCTIGPFLVLVGGIFLEGSNPENILTFILYGLGMGFMVFILGMIVLLAGGGLGTWIRRHIGTVIRVSGFLFILAGIYIMLFTLVEIDVLFASSSGSSEMFLNSKIFELFVSVVDAAGGIQSNIVAFFESLNSIGIILVALVLTCIFIVSVVLKNLFSQNVDTSTNKNTSDE